MSRDPRLCLISANDEHVSNLINNIGNLEFRKLNRTIRKSQRDKKTGLLAEVMFAIHHNLTAQLDYTNKKYGDGGVDFVSIYDNKIDVKTFNTFNKTITLPKKLRLSKVNNTKYVADSFAIYFDGKRYTCDEDDTKYFGFYFYGFIRIEDISLDVLHGSNEIDKNGYVSCYMYLDDLKNIAVYHNLEALNNSRLELI